MSTLDWAKREVEIACKRENPDREPGEWDYGCACYESALKAYRSITRDILIRLMRSLPLTTPYIPPSKPYKVVIDEFLSDSKNDDFGHVTLL